MLGTPTSQGSVISREGLKCSFLFKNFKIDYTHRRLRLAFFLFDKIKKMCKNKEN
ncbi:hypothetical protein U752_10370 [Streptococcus pseudopneumoniae 1321]|nr:hypothetical protein U752_10370 [Streptococcus pseudopneumoniae 1321]